MTKAKENGWGPARGRAPTDFKLYALDDVGETKICFTCLFSSVVGSEDDMTWNQNTQKVQVVFWYSYLHERH